MTNDFRIQALLQISKFQRSKANHNDVMTLPQIYFVVTNIKISKIESKSQLHFDVFINFRSCYKYQNFKDRKQITTVRLNLTLSFSLLQISKFQRSKANHNEGELAWTSFKLLQISKFQRSKANHNSPIAYKVPYFVVTNIKISKIESKSQPDGLRHKSKVRCYKYQNFKDRKQITTRMLTG